MLKLRLMSKNVNNDIITKIYPTFTEIILKTLHNSKSLYDNTLRQPGCRTVIRNKSWFIRTQIKDRQVSVPYMLSLSHNLSSHTFYLVPIRMRVYKTWPMYLFSFFTRRWFDKCLITYFVLLFSFSLQTL